MFTHRSAWSSHGALVSICVVAMAIAGCDRAPKAVARNTAIADASVATGRSAPAPEPIATASTPSAMASSATKKVPVVIQGVAPAGLTVRVKGVEIGGDATVLDVSISFANRITNSTMLALTDTFIEDESGARLHVKRPENNRDISLREGETLEGQLVFLGSVPVNARAIKVVFNDGNPGDNIVAPGLTINLPLQGS